MVVVGVLVLFLALIIPTFALGEKRISEQTMVNKYENKYLEINNKIEETKRQEQLKIATIQKLESLKAQYAQQYGTGASVIEDINKDIENLKK
jgi:predicted PurR-regulated permease PerM